MRWRKSLAVALGAHFLRAPSSWLHQNSPSELGEGEGETEGEGVFEVKDGTCERSERACRSIHAMRAVDGRLTGSSWTRVGLTRGRGFSCVSATRKGKRHGRIEEPEALPGEKSKAYRLATPWVDHPHVADTEASYAIVIKAGLGGRRSSSSNGA